MIKVMNLSRDYIVWPVLSVAKSANVFKVSKYIADNDIIIIWIQKWAIKNWRKDVIEHLFNIHAIKNVSEIFSPTLVPSKTNFKESSAPNGST